MSFLLEPPASRIHGAEDNKFSYVSPPLDGSLIISELYDYHYANNPNHPVFQHAGGSTVKHLRFRDVVPAAYVAARTIAKAIDIDLDAGERLATPIALLASSDTTTSFTTVVGMLRADITFFMIWPEHSAASIAHLLSSVPVSHFFISQDPGRWEVAEEAIRQMKGDSKPVLRKLPTYEELYKSEVAYAPFRKDPRRKDLDVTRFVVHSSGSTAFPKPIFWNDRVFLQVGTTPLHGERDLLGEVFGCFGTALHYGGGLNLVAWLAASGLVVATFAPAVVGPPLASDTIWYGLLENRPKYLYPGPPKILEEWHKDPAKLPILKEIVAGGGIVFAGAPLLKTVGDTLANAGISLHTLYGSTEVGAYAMMFQDNPGTDWEYFTVNPQMTFEFVPLGDGRFEPLVMKSPTTAPTVINVDHNGKPGFRTKDIVEPHPTMPNKWRVLGRLDDEIVLTTGDKTTPGPLEDIICADVHIRSAVMFGTGKNANGVLIDPAKEYTFDPQDTTKLNEYLDLIWPAIEAANTFAPSFSQLRRELVSVASPRKPFEYNPKGQPKRVPVLKAYADEIEVMYAKVERAT